MEPLPELSQLMDLPAVLAEVEAGALPKEALGPGPYPDVGLVAEVADAPEAGDSSSGTDKPQGEYFFEYNFTFVSFSWVRVQSWVCFS